MNVMIQYTNKLPSKVDYFELIRTVYEDVDVSELSSELDSTIACICSGEIKTKRMPS